MISGATFSRACFKIACMLTIDAIGPLISSHSAVIVRDLFVILSRISFFLAGLGTCCANSLWNAFTSLSKDSYSSFKSMNLPLTFSSMADSSWYISALFPFALIPIYSPLATFSGRVARRAPWIIAVRKNREDWHRRSSHPPLARRARSGSRPRRPGSADRMRRCRGSGHGNPGWVSFFPTPRSFPQGEDMTAPEHQLARHRRRGQQLLAEIPQMAPVLGIDDVPTTEVGQHDRHRDAILSVGTDRKRLHGRRQPVAAGSAGLRRMALSSTAAITCLPPIMSPAQAILAAGRSDAGSRQRATLARRPRRAGRRRSGHAGRSGRRS